MSQRLLVVEDDRTLRTALQDSFVAEGYEVHVAGSGDAAMQVVFTRHFDLIVLDLMLPGPGGLEILRELRAAGLATPVLVLTARAEESDKVLGLELGADDYVTKPFSLRELVARVRALLRRHATAGAPAGVVEEPLEFQVGEARVDLGAFTLTRDGASTSLSRTEAAMLRLLFEARGQAVSRTRFLREVWSGGESVGNRTIDTHVLNLRQKLEPGAGRPRYLQTVHGVGYRLVLD